MTSKSTSSYARYGCALRRSQANPVERRIGPDAPSASACSVVMTPTPTRRSSQIGFDQVAHTQRRFGPAVGQIGGDTPGADEVVVHPEPRDHLEQPKRLLAIAPAVDHHRQRADVHAV